MARAAGGAGATLAVLEAAALPPRNAPPARVYPVSRIANTLRDRPPLSDDPAEWRVRFALWPQGMQRRASRDTRFGGPSSRVLENALPLAKRIEALWRMIEDRKTYVQRMANLLAARRDKAFIAFAPYRFGGPFKIPLAETQAELDAALTNTS